MITTSVQAVIDRVRLRLDETLDVGTNLWTDEELIEYMNEGLEEIWLTARESKQDFGMRKVTSTDAPFAVAGRMYNPALLQLRQGVADYPLPPDFAELRLFEPVVAADQFQPDCYFDFAPQSDPEWRARYRVSASEGFRQHLFTIEHRVDGWWLVLAPAWGSSGTQEIVIKYITTAPEVTQDGTFEGTGLTKEGLTALVHYTVYLAKQKPEEDANALFSSYERKRTVALRAAGPRQSRDPEYVVGSLEEDE